MNINYHYHPQVQIVALNNKLQQAAKDSTANLSRVEAKHNEKASEWEKGRAELESRLKASNQIQQEMSEALEKLKKENHELKSKIQDQTWKVKDAEDKLRKAESSVKEKEDARAAAQTELDDLFVVLGDLEEKRTKDKVSI